MRKFLSILLIALCAASAPAHADETGQTDLPALQPTLTLSELAAATVLMERAVDGVQATLDGALGLLGIRYKRGGTSPESGFDCSGFVRHVFNESLGLMLPHNALAISRASARIEKKELLPGDLVFFRTMRRTFSHVGIYLGDNQFIHAPRSGQRVRIENMTDRYWSRRFDGARRVKS